MFQGLRLSGYFMLPAFCETSGVYVLQSLIMENVSSLAATEDVSSQSSSSNLGEGRRNTKGLRILTGKTCSEMKQFLRKFP